jgi:hypothetical protein
MKLEVFAMPAGIDPFEFGPDLPGAGLVVFHPDSPSKRRRSRAGIETSRFTEIPPDQEIAGKATLNQLLFWASRL